MTHESDSKLNLSMNPVALSSYAVALVSFAGAGVGLISNHFPSTGLAIVGGLYLMLGVFSKAPKSGFHPSNQAISGLTAGADNLVAEPISGKRETVSTSDRARELASTSSR